MSIVAIDPGVNGAVACMMRRGKKVKVVARPLPTRPGPGGRPEIDVQKLHRMLQNVFPIEIVVVEIVHATPVWGKVSCFKFGKTYGATLAVIELLGLPIEFVTPQRWKRDVLKGLGTDKTAAARWCQQRYPKLDIHAKTKTGKRSKNFHDGMADAVCMAEYGRLVLR